MIEAGKLLDLFERMEREHWGYELGAAREGLVDCSGAFVWAFKQLGGSIEHGSNSIYHLRVGKVVPVSEARPGYAVFKMRAWREEDRGNRWYGESPGDCYHIGLMGRDGKVLNAQSVKTGFVASDAKGWSFAAPLKAVEYETEGGGKMFGNATVTTAGGALNIREGASTAAKVIGKVANGTRVNVIREATSEWMYGMAESGEIGYMASVYLRADSDDDSNHDSNADDKNAGNTEKNGDANYTGNVEVSTTTLRRSDGVYITLAGKWTIAED